jgi:tetratricopeptide (TPR) repeat protein
MHLIRFALPAVLLLAALAPAEAQLRANRPPPRVNTNPRMLVANPYPANSADSAAAVRIGDGMRKRLEDIAGRWFNTITREQMNDALLQYAYPPDAVLPPPVARTLASQLQARFLVSSTLNRTEGGRYALQVRAIGMNDKVGHATTQVQQPNQSLEEFGKTAADGLRSAMEALEEARKCWDQQLTKPRDAVAAAARALRIQPNHGLAAYCLGEIAKGQKAPPDTLLAHYRRATEGDAQSLEAWSEVLILYQQRQDSTRTVETLQHMLRVAPTNQALREQAFNLLLRYGRPNAAKELAEEGLQIDPTNADLWDLKSNACLFMAESAEAVEERNRHFMCAVDALEQVFDVDSARADSAFYNKIGVAASQQPDTVRLLRWARRGVAKYPDNATLLGHLVTAYTHAGPPDSAIVAVQRLMALDSTDLRPVLRVIQILAAEKRLTDAFPLGEYVERLGDASDKQNYAVLLINGALPLLQQQPPDLDGAEAMTRKSLAMSPAGSQLGVNAHYVLGLTLALRFGVEFAQRDAAIMEQKSCDLARQQKALRDEAEQELTAGQSANPSVAASWLQRIQGATARVEQQVRSFCR